eukprot:357663-Chlamydomonas_euryale.AAC.12
MQAPALAPGRGTGGRGASTAANAPSGAFGFQIGHGRVAPEPTAVASVSSGLLLRVGTWNCEHLALDMPSGPQHAKLLHMANAIVAANLEVVALQVCFLTRHCFARHALFTGTHLAVSVTLARFAMHKSCPSLHIGYTFELAIPCRLCVAALVAGGGVEETWPSCREAAGRAS